MPEWIEDRKNHIMAKNPSMPESEAWGIATQQAHAVGKSPKGYGTAEGRAMATAKYPTPSDDKKTANPGRLKPASIVKEAWGLTSIVPGTEGVHLPGFKNLSGAVEKIKSNLGGVVKAAPAVRPAKTLEEIYAARRAAYRPSGVKSAMMSAFFDELEKIADMGATWSSGDFRSSAYSGGSGGGGSGFKQTSITPPMRIPSLASVIEKKGSMLSSLRKPASALNVFKAPSAAAARVPTAGATQIKDFAPKPLTAKFENMQPGAVRMTAMPGTSTTHI